MAIQLTIRGSMSSRGVHGSRGPLDAARLWPIFGRPKGRVDAGDETAVFIMSIFRRRVYETIGGFDDPCERTRTTISGSAQRWRDTDSAPRSTSATAAATAGLSAVELRMLRGIVRVLRRTRPCFPGSRSSSQSSTASSAIRDRADRRRGFERQSGGDFRQLAIICRLFTEAWRGPRRAADSWRDGPRLLSIVYSTDTSGIRIISAGAIVMKLRRHRDLQTGRGSGRRSSLAGLRPDGPWEVIVVDNNSPDETRAVVEQRHQPSRGTTVSFFEREQGAACAEYRHSRRAQRNHRDNGRRCRVPPIG
jgi:hypothetical protein